MLQPTSLMLQTSLMCDTTYPTGWNGCYKKKKFSTCILKKLKFLDIFETHIIHRVYYEVLYAVSPMWKYKKIRIRENELRVNFVTTYLSYMRMEKWKINCVLLLKDAVTQKSIFFCFNFDCIYDRIREKSKGLVKSTKSSAASGQRRGNECAKLLVDTSANSGKNFELQNI